MPIQPLAQGLARFPWKSAALTLRQRFREDRLGITASSLTFTTTIALVPLFTVVLAVFTAFPIFGKLQASLQAWLVQSLIPDSIARQVIGYLTQFSGKANKLGSLGFAALLLSAFALVLTIDRTLNAIWRVRRPRPLGHRVMVYWAVMTLGPLILAGSLSITSYAISASRGLVSAIPGAVQFLLDIVEFALLAGGLTALYRFVPHTAVRPAHALVGGVFGAIGIELAKRLLGWYLGLVPGFSIVYGAFATFPILLVWLYIAWLVVLMGAVLAAHLPTLLAAPRRRSTGVAWPFELALEALHQLADARASERRGLTGAQLAQAMDVDALQLEPVLETLVQLDWVGRLNEIEDDAQMRYILLADPATTPVAPLLRQMVLPASTSTAKLWDSARLSSLRLEDVL